MEKKKLRLFTAVWMLVASGIRILYFFLGNRHIADTYEYYAHSVIELGKKEPFLTSGLAYVYTEKLSNLLGFMGNHMEPIAAYQMLMQVAWLVVFFFGMRLLFGNVGGLAAGSVLALTPWLLGTIFVVTPENYLMLVFSVLLLALGFFYKRTKVYGWHRSNGCEIYLMILGFLTGVVCIWNYMGWLLVVLMIYVLYGNHHNLEERLWEQKQKEELEEKYRLMPVSSQAFILTLGILVGMFATLMKYTGFTGLPVVEQFIWWLNQFQAFPGRCQDISIWLAAWLLLAVVVGIVCERTEKAILRKRLLKEMYGEESAAEKEEQEEEQEQEQEENSIVTEDGRRIKLLDNPLPVPKRHVKKKMNFKVNETGEQQAEKEKKDDFDHQTDADDDFDV